MMYDIYELIKSIEKTRKNEVYFVFNATPYETVKGLFYEKWIFSGVTKNIYYPYVTIYDGHINGFNKFGVSVS